jgi:hypothetical protein
MPSRSCRACCRKFARDSQRSDKMTCSDACRVKAHRSGKLKQIRRMAEAADISPGMLAQCQALLVLCPHLEAAIIARKKNLKDTRAEVWSAYWRLLKCAVEN